MKSKRDYSFSILLGAFCPFGSGSSDPGRCFDAGRIKASAGASAWPRDQYISDARVDGAFNHDDLDCKFKFSRLQLSGEFFVDLAVVGQRWFLRLRQHHQLEEVAFFKPHRLSRMLLILILLRRRLSRLLLIVILLRRCSSADERCDE